MPCGVGLIFWKGEGKMEKIVLITGASRGIGAACAQLFAKDGWSVAVNYCASEERAQQVCGAIREAGGIALPVQADVADGEQVAAMVQQVERELGPIDVLVNNAGIAWEGLLTDMKEEEWDRVLSVNLKGVYHCCRAVLPSMVHRHSGRIINISSMWGQVGASCEVAYSASKAGVIGLTRALAKEMGPSGITVNAIAPGVIDTEMNACYDEETMQALKEETPLMRLGTGEDVARAVLFLAGPGGDFITGQVLGVSGGFVI